MNFNFKTDEDRYRFITDIKKVCPETVNSVILFNQKILMACGKIDYALRRLSKVDRDRFISDNKKFFDSFAWSYYIDWRKSRAKSCAHLSDVYSMLNVKFTVHDFVGETFYAGIPKVNIDEINDAIISQQSGEYTVCEKVGIDGKLHRCNADGSFPEIIDFNDTYGDGSMITKQELDAYSLED